QPVKSVVVTADKANVRKGPGTGNDVVAQIEKGDGAKFISKVEGWVEIKTAKGDHGWIADFLVLGE
nr:SH3 domain-containing protein [Gammaproteobacteria bacterium]NIR92341.1 SH3 domain-containing protein [Gammaproteobacteria bacterium]